VEHQIELTADALWEEVAGRLRGALNEATFGTWFAEAGGVALTDDAFTLAVPNDFTREWIEGHFLGLIRAAVKDATGHERRVRLTVVDGADPYRLNLVGTRELDRVVGGVPRRETKQIMFSLKLIPDRDSGRAAHNLHTGFLVLDVLDVREVAGGGSAGESVMPQSLSSR